MINSTNPQVTQPHAPTYQKVAAILKSIISYTALAALTTVSFQFAMLNEGLWVKCITSFCALNALLLPKVLHSDNEKMIRIGLLVNAIAFGVLPLGGMVATSFLYFRSALILLKMGHISIALFQGALASGILGYICPITIRYCRTSKELLHYPKVWQEKISYIQNQFRYLSRSFWEWSLPFFRLENGIVSTESLHKHHFVLKSAMMREVSLDQWNASLCDIENKIYNKGFLPQYLNQYYKVNLEVLLQYLKKEDLEQAIPSLLSLGTRLVPNILSKEEFLEFFKGDVLNKVDDLIEKFIDKIIHLNEYDQKYQKLNDELIQLEVTLNQNNLSKNDKAISSQKYEAINKEFIELRLNIKELSITSKPCKELHVLCSDPSKLPFKQKDKLALVLQDASLFKRINQLEVFTTRSKLFLEQRFGNLKQLMHQLAQPTLRNSFESINKELMPLFKKCLGGANRKDEVIYSKLAGLSTRWSNSVTDYEELFRKLKDIFEGQSLSTKLDTTEQDYKTLCDEIIKIFKLIDKIKASRILDHMSESQDETHEWIIQGKETEQKYQKLQSQFDTLIGQLSSNRQMPDALQTTLQERILEVHDKIVALDNTQNGNTNVPSYMVFATHYHFVDADFERLRKILGVDAINDPCVDLIDEAMKDLGLNTPKDVQTSGILPPVPQVKEKEDEAKAQIFANLENYIKNYNSSPQIQPSLKTKVAHLFYRMIAMGFVLVPVLVYPYPAAAGFAVGACYCILKRFGATRIKQMETRLDRSSIFKRITPFHRSFLKMPIITEPLIRRYRANQVFNANFFGKIQRIAETLLYSSVTNVAPISALRGFTFAQEILT